MSDAEKSELNRMEMASHEGSDASLSIFEEQIRARLTWLFVFRAVLLTLILVVTAGLRIKDQGHILDDSNLWSISAVCLAGFASILAGGVWIRIKGTQQVFALAVIQVGLDALTTTLLIWLTGGVESGFAFLYSVAVLGAAAVLGRRGAFATASLVGLFYSAMVIFEVFAALTDGVSTTTSLTKLLPPYFVNFLAFFLVAFLSGFLSDQESRASKKLVEAREQVVALEDFAEAVLESLPSGVLTVDADNRLLFVNRAAGELLGEQRDELVGRMATEVLPGLPDGPRPERARINFELELGSEFERRNFAGTTASLTGLEGRTGRVVVFDDETELKLLQREANRNQELATVGRFAAGLAHEIRNPLAAMLGCLSLLEKDVAEGVTGAETERMVSIVHHEAERLSDLVSAFLTYARPAPPRRDNINLAQTVHETLDTLLAGNDIDEDVDVTVDVWASPTVRCDPSQFRQVTWNVVKNAIEAAQGKMGRTTASENAASGNAASENAASGNAASGNAASGNAASGNAVSGNAASNNAVRITIDATDRAGLVVVEDSGPGIKLEHREHIFEPFFTTRKGGTGLGLAESHQLMAAQGGRIDVGESEDFGGARIEISIPMVEFAEVSRAIPVAEGLEEPVPHRSYRAPSSSDLPPVKAPALSTSKKNDSG